MLERRHGHLHEIRAQRLEPVHGLLACRRGDRGGIEDHHVVEHHVVEAVGLLGDADKLGLEALIVVGTQGDGPAVAGELQTCSRIDHLLTRRPFAAVGLDRLVVGALQRGEKACFM